MNVPVNNADFYTLIIGQYGYGNMGDESILQGVLEKISDKNIICVLSATPEETNLLHDVKSISIKELNNYQYGEVILGGGSYSPSAIEIPGELCLSLKKIGARLKVKSIGVSQEIAGQTALGAFTESEKALFRDLYTNADSFSVRTFRDREKIEQIMGLEGDILVERDPAYDISYSKALGREMLDALGFSSGGKLCGISLGKFGFRRGLLNFLREYKDEYTFIPIPMCRHYYAAFEYDPLLLKKYFKELSLYSEAVKKCINYTFKPSELKSILSNMDYLITSRKHAMILALGGGLDADRIILLGTRESGLAEYFDVKEIDWRQWRRSDEGIMHKIDLTRLRYSQTKGEKSHMHVLKRALKRIRDVTRERSKKY